MTDNELLAKITENFEFTQDYQETLWTLSRIRHHLGGKKVESIVDLGKGEGDLVCMLSRLLKKDGLIIRVHEDSRTARFNEEFLKSVASIDNSHIFVIEGDTKDPAIFDDVKITLGETPLRILIIDTIHVEEQTRAEWELYGKLLVPPAVAYFQGIAAGFGQYDNPGRIKTTRDFWNQFKYYVSYEEKRSKPHKSPMGVGLVFL